MNKKPSDIPIGCTEPAQTGIEGPSRNYFRDSPFVMGSAIYWSAGGNPAHAIPVTDDAVASTAVRIPMTANDGKPDCPNVAAGAVTISEVPLELYVKPPPGAEYAPSTTDHSLAPGAKGLPSGFA